jgi:hypothetical protein
MGIEPRCDAPHKKFRAVADRKPIVDHGYGAVGDEALDPRPVHDGGSNVPAVQPRYKGQIDREVAHDRLDDVGAEAEEQYMQVDDAGRRTGGARRLSVAVFGVTVDADAESYFPTLFGRGGYALVGNIRRLPAALPAIYQQLVR